MNPLEYVARGWSLLPCHSVRRDGSCTCKDGATCKAAGKHPRTLHGVKDASSDPGTILRWQEMFGHEMNWAVATGEVSNIVVVDVDPRNDGDKSLDGWIAENGDLPTTLTTITGGGGYHFFFRYPHDGHGAGNRPNFMPGVDFKSDGGYVMLPPSRHASGAQYAWRDHTVGIETIPEMLLIAVRSSESSAVRIDTTNLEKISSGSRNDTLFRLACRLRRQLSDDRLAVEASVRAYNAFRCEEPLGDAEVQKLIDSAFRQDHADTDLGFVVVSESEGIRHLTDDGNAHRVVDYHGGDLRFVPTWGWMRYTGRTWVGDGEGLCVQDRARLIHADIRREAERVTDDDLKTNLLKWAGQSENISRIKAMIELAKSDARVNRSHEAFDVSTTLIACRNGMLDLVTGELRDHSPDDYVTRCTNVDYDPDAYLDEWENFIRHACDEDEDLIQYVQRAAGYSLSGSVGEECFFVIVGPAASGKSTFAAGMHAALGGYAGSVASDTILIRGQQARRESDLAGTVGKRFMSVVELPEGERLDESVVKQITGGDEVSARFLYKNPFTFKPQFKLWIATNHEPRINDEAIWRRIKRIPFPRGLASTQRNPRVKELVSNPEIGGRAVLAWAVRGYRMYQETRLAEPQRVTLETQAYHMRQDKIGQFIADTAIAGDGDDHITVADLYMRYTSWCAMTGERPWTMSSFSARLDGRQNVSIVRLNGQTWVRGLRLKAASGGMTQQGGNVWGL